MFARRSLKVSRKTKAIKMRTCLQKNNKKSSSNLLVQSCGFVMPSRVGELKSVRVVGKFDINRGCARRCCIVDALNVRCSCGACEATRSFAAA